MHSFHGVHVSKAEHCSSAKCQMWLLELMGHIKNIAMGIVPVVGLEMHQVRHNGKFIENLTTHCTVVPAFYNASDQRTPLFWGHHFVNKKKYIIVSLHKGQLFLWDTCFGADVSLKGRDDCTVKPVMSLDVKFIFYVVNCCWNLCYRDIFVVVLLSQILLWSSSAHFQTPTLHVHIPPLSP